MRAHGEIQTARRLVPRGSVSALLTRPYATLWQARQQCKTAAAVRVRYESFVAVSSVSTSYGPQWITHKEKTQLACTTCFSKMTHRSNTRLIASQHRQRASACITSPAPSRSGHAALPRVHEVAATAVEFLSLSRHNNPIAAG